jgi:anti-sigma regulatory factor (Ser/Thr protein kinase)
VTVVRAFARSFDELAAIVAFTAEAFAQEGVDPALRPDVDFALEELFTNMVKYSPDGEAAIMIDVTGIAGGVEVRMTDRGVEPFDVTQAPDADVTLPLEARRPGGLGLHLIRRLLDSIDYEYTHDLRQSRITFRKTKGGVRASQGVADTGRR